MLTPLSFPASPPPSPDIDLGDNILALPDLLKTVEGATALVFVLPHQVGPPANPSTRSHFDSSHAFVPVQFLPRIISQLKGHVPTATRAISCIKGVEVHEDRIDIFARVIEQELGMSCSALR
jgi:glycerol-3-phosphate dehydrogenase (NAD+)